jgi:hypothetical protein
MDASYPDVAMLLAQAGATQNLPGRIEIDALPQAGRTYMRPRGEVASSSDAKARVGNSNLVPNLFSSYSETTGKEKRKEEADDAINAKSDEATAEKPDEKSGSKKDKASRDRAALRGKNKSGAAGADDKEDLRAETSPTKMRVAKKTSKIDEAPSEMADDDGDPDEMKPESQGRSWNPLRFFRGFGQSEPDVEDSEASTTKKSETVAKSESSSEPPAQSEP